MFAAIFRHYDVLVSYVRLWLCMRDYRVGGVKGNMVVDAGFSGADPACLDDGRACGHSILHSLFSLSSFIERGLLYGVEDAAEDT